MIMRVVVMPGARPWPRILARTAVVAVAWAAAIIAAALVHPTGWVHDAALFVHLLALVCGFGAVVVLDFYGAGCLTRRRSPVHAARLAVSVDPLIWGGFFVLILTGALMTPELADPLTRIKLIAVLAAGINAVNASGLRDAIGALPATATLHDLPRPLLWRLAITTLVSQAAWWSAILVGFWNNPHE